MEPLSGELWLHMNKPLSQRSNEHTSCEKENHYQVKILENNGWEAPTIADDLLVYFPLWKHKCIQEQKCSDLWRIWKALQFRAQYLTTSWKDTPLDPFHCTVLSVKDTKQLCLFTSAWVQVQRTSSKLCWTKWNYAHSAVKNFKKTPGFFHWTASAWVLSQYSIFLKFWTLHSSSEVENYRCEFVKTFWRTLNVPARGVYAVYVKFPCKHRACNMFHSRSTINTIRHPLADMCDCMSEFGCTCKERDLKGKANKSWHDINLREKGNHHAIIACCELWKLLIHLPWSSGHTSH